MDYAMNWRNDENQPRSENGPGNPKREIDEEPKSKRARNEDFKIENETEPTSVNNRLKRLSVESRKLQVDNVLREVLNVGSGESLVVSENQTFIIDVDGILNILAGGKVVISNNSVLEVSLGGKMQIALGGRLFVYQRGHLKVRPEGTLILEPGLAVHNGLSTITHQTERIFGNGTEWSLTPLHNVQATIATGRTVLQKTNITPKASLQETSFHNGRNGGEKEELKLQSPVGKESFEMVAKTRVPDEADDVQNGGNGETKKEVEQHSPAGKESSEVFHQGPVVKRESPTGKKNSKMNTKKPVGDKADLQNRRENKEEKKEDDDKPVTKDDILLTLPSTPFFKAFSILFKDVQKLDRQQYVNDTIIEFMLNHMSTNQIRPEMIAKVHIFDTFFYTNLSRDILPMIFCEGLPPASAQMETQQEKQQKVLVNNCNKILQFKHNKKFDLFSKKLIVIPINDMYHWVAAAVINPGGALVETGKEEESHKAPKCYIMFYDSLFGLDSKRRIHYASMITGYLETASSNTKAANTKYGGERGYTFERDRVVVMSPKNAPVQPNFTDCGLYALHFIEGMLCNSFRPVTVKDLPEFDWSKISPEADKMCELMRDRIYMLVKKKAGAKGRSRLEKFERENKCGLDREGALQNSRRHSAAPLRRLDRHRNYHRRSFTLNPPLRNLKQDKDFFANPRLLNCDPLYQQIRKLRLPEFFPPPKLHCF